MTAPTIEDVENAFEASGGLGDVVRIRDAELRTLLRNVISNLGGGGGGSGSSGTVGLVQLSDGAGGFSSDAELSYDGTFYAPGVSINGSLFPARGTYALPDNGYVSWDDGVTSINVSLNASSFSPSAILLVDRYANCTNAADLGAVGAEVRTGYFGTSVVTPVTAYTPMTTTERDALTPAAGWHIFNSTLGKEQICVNATGPVWQTVTSV